MKGSNVVITLQCPLGFLIGDRNYCCDRGTSSTRTRTLSEFVLLSGAPLGPTSLGPTSLRPFGFVRAKGGYPPAPLPPEGGGGATLRPSGGRPPLALLLGPTSGGSRAERGTLFGWAGGGFVLPPPNPENPWPERRTKGGARRTKGGEGWDSSGRKRGKGQAFSTQPPDKKKEGSQKRKSVLSFGFFDYFFDIRF